MAIQKLQQKSMTFQKEIQAMEQKLKKPILERVKDYSSAKIVTLDGSIIGDESIINQIL